MIIDELLSIYGDRGSAAYFGEPVSVTEHGLQAAHFARVLDAPDSLVVAALLHDIGHLINSAPDDLSEWTTDDRHEVIGSLWLSLHFGPEVSEPVRLHVPAKRYLCATEPAYIATLSAASVVTLGLQGGPMTRAETEAFEAEPYFRDAVNLRRWDEQAKIAGLSTPDFVNYQPSIERLAAAIT
jgi:[1-hydroxy-2-(trimethylamino)ethyl]phosphonate dioxygenase